MAGVVAGKKKPFIMGEPDSKINTDGKCRYDIDR